MGRLTRALARDARTTAVPPVPGSGEGQCQARERGLAVKPPSIAVEQDGAEESGKPQERKYDASAAGAGLGKRVTDATKFQQASEGHGALRGMNDRQALGALVEAKKQNTEEKESDHGQSTD